MKRQWVKIGISLCFFAFSFLVADNFSVYKSVLLAIAYLIVGLDVIRAALGSLVRGNALDENFLMSAATVGAIAIGQYHEAVAVMLFYQTGELCQAYAVGKSRQSIAGLMDICPDYANVWREGKWQRVLPENVEPGERIMIKPGEKVPLECRVVQGQSLIDTAALTGESAPVACVEGDNLISGTINLRAPVFCDVTAVFADSTVQKILDLVENSSEKKSRQERFITRFARSYTPAVVGLSLVIGIVPPLLTGKYDFAVWVYRALTFLVVSCPCALVISVPLTFFGGIGSASRQGILMKGGSYLEVLAKATTCVFDKTGTLTNGLLSVRSLHPASGFVPAELSELAALAEYYSDHPVGVALREYCQQELRAERIEKIEELAGFGIRATIDGHRVLVGNSRLLADEGVAGSESEEGVHIAVNGCYAGSFQVVDEVKSDAAAVMNDLRHLGVGRLVLLTGDRRAPALELGAALGLDEVKSELLPTDKVLEVEHLLCPEEKLVFVGDGINDAPALARADVGVAMGGLGSAAAIEAADIVLLSDELKKIPQAIGIARKTLRIARQNIVFALGVKGVVLGLACVGFVSMWAAVFADVGVTLLAVVNSFRALQPVQAG